MRTSKNGAIKMVLLYLSLGCMLCGAFYFGCAVISDRIAISAHDTTREALRYQAQATAAPAAASTPSAAGSAKTLAPIQTEAGNYAASLWFEDYKFDLDRTIDFAALQAVNPDIYAWITVPGTAIDYPVAHREKKGDLFYLTHDETGKRSKHGAIYTDGYNSSDFSDPLTLVYGHNMRDGSMFAGLHDFENSAFFAEHSYIQVYRDDYMFRYKIIAAYKTTDTHILAVNDFSDPTVFAGYLRQIYTTRDLNAKLRPYELSSGNRIITLSTCISGEDKARYFVQGVLQKNE